MKRLRYKSRLPAPAAPSRNAVSEAQTQKSVDRGAVYGRFRYSDLKESALRDYGI